MTPHAHAPRWGEMSRALKARRRVMGLPQDLSSRGGPGEITVRKMERGTPVVVRRRSWSGVEHALDWPDGILDRLLAGTAGAATDEVVVRVGSAAIVRAGVAAAASAPVVVHQLSEDPAAVAATDTRGSAALARAAYTAGALAADLSLLPRTRRIAAALEGAQQVFRDLLVEQVAQCDDDPLTMSRDAVRSPS